MYSTETPFKMLLLAETPVYRYHIVGPEAWKRSSFSSVDEWTYRLSNDTVRELEQALSRIRRSGRGLSSMTPEDFDSPTLRRQASEVRQELCHGRGFVLVRGLDPSDYTEEDASILFWGLGTSLGRSLPQNIRGDLVFSVRDEGHKIVQEWGKVGVRLSKTAKRLPFHTDSAPALLGNTPDCVALFALQTAKAGGATSLVSGRTVHNIILAEKPSYLDRLYGKYHFDRRAEVLPGEPVILSAPIFSYRGGVRIRYLRFYLTQPEILRLIGKDLTQADLAPLDYLDEIMGRDEIQVRFRMERGDIQLVNNTFILHSRTDFDDELDPTRRRHFKRLWLSVSEKTC